MVPVKEVNPKYNVSILSRFPISVGIVPSKLVSPISTTLKFVNSPIVVGIGPENFRKERSRYSTKIQQTQSVNQDLFVTMAVIQKKKKKELFLPKDSSSLMVSGRVPSRSRLPQGSSRFKFLNPNISGGSVPLILLLPIAKTSKSVKFPKLSGIPPLKALLLILNTAGYKIQRNE